MERAVMNFLELRAALTQQGERKNCPQPEICGSKECEFCRDTAAPAQQPVAYITDTAKGHTMTTLQEAARKALASLELYDHEDLASCEARHELRTALAQQGEQAKPAAYITPTEQGPMVWTSEMYDEACTYCDDGEFPVPLYTAAHGIRADDGLRAQPLV